MQTHIVLNLTASLDGRVDEKEDPLSNRLDDYRIQLLRRDVDAILTTSEYVNSTNTDFPCSDPENRRRIIVIDKTASLNPKSAVITGECFDVTLVVPTSAIKSRVKTLEKAKAGLDVRYVGEHAVNLENLLWELQKENVKNILLECDYQTNMRFLNYRLVDELYVLVCPKILGSKTSVFDGKVDENISLVLDGITQYGDYVLLHYLVK